MVHYSFYLKKIWCVWLTVGVVLLIAVALAPAAQAWSSQRLGLTFRDPSGWKVYDVNQADAVIRYIAPSSPGLRSLISLNIKELEAADSQLAVEAEHIDGVVAALKQQGKDVQILGSRDSELSGIKAHRLAFIGKHGKYKVRVTQVMCICSGKLYVFVLSSSPENHAKVLPVFEKMLKSVRFTA